MIGLLLGALAPILGDVLGKVIPDADARAKALQEVQMSLLAKSREIELAAADIVKTEAGSTHWITAAWRPILMLVFTAIIANNFILAPYAEAVFNVSLLLPLPDQLWTLINIGVGGYVVSRGAEKVAKEFKGTG